MKERIKQIIRTAYEKEKRRAPKCNILLSEESYLVIITFNSDNFTQMKAKTITSIKEALESECLRMKYFKPFENFFVMELFPFEYEGT